VRIKRDSPGSTESISKSLNPFSFMEDLDAAGADMRNVGLHSSREIARWDEEEKQQDEKNHPC
jgi:hypothetical protein